MITHPSALDDAYGTQVWEPFCQVDTLDPEGALLGTVTPSGGSVTFDGNVWPRVTATIELPAGLDPSQTVAPVSPFGGSVIIRAGAVVQGVRWSFTVATLPVVRTRIARPDNLVTLECASHEVVVNEDRYDTATTTAAGASSEVVTDLIQRTLGVWGVSFDVSSDPTLAAGAFNLDGDVWPTIRQIADQAGWDIRTDPSGNFVVTDEHINATGHPVLTVKAAAGGTLTGYDSERRWGHNRFAVVYEDPAGSRIVGLWEDTDPTSPTRVSGPYGSHTDTTTVSVPTLPSQAAADKAAATRAKRGRVNRSIGLRAMPAPWIEPGDTVRAGLLGGVTRDLVLAAVTWPLDQLDVMELTLRDQVDTSESY